MGGPAASAGGAANAGPGIVSTITAPRADARASLFFITNPPSTEPAVRSPFETTCRSREGTHLRLRRQWRAQCGCIQGQARDPDHGDSSGDSARSNSREAACGDRSAEQPFGWRRSSPHLHRSTPAERSEGEGGQTLWPVGTSRRLRPLLGHGSSCRRSEVMTEDSARSHRQERKADRESFHWRPWSQTATLSHMPGPGPRRGLTPDRARAAVCAATRSHALELPPLRTSNR